MLKLFSSLFLVCVLIACEEKVVEPVSRFQLVAGQFNRTTITNKDGRGDTELFKTVFKIDTQTGKVWYFEPGLVPSLKSVDLAIQNQNLFKDKWTAIEN